MASASMVAIGSPGDFLMHWFWWALVMVPFCFVVFQLVVRMSKLSVLLCLCVSRSSCEDQPCVTGDWFVAGFAVLGRHSLSMGLGDGRWYHDEAH